MKERKEDVESWVDQLAYTRTETDIQEGVLWHIPVRHEPTGIDAHLVVVEDQPERLTIRISFRIDGAMADQFINPDQPVYAKILRSLLRELLRGECRYSFDRLEEEQILVLTVFEVVWQEELTRAVLDRRMQRVVGAAALFQSYHEELAQYVLEDSDAERDNEVIDGQ